MNRTFLLLAIAVSTFPAIAADGALVLRSPTVVILRDTQAEVRAHRKDQNYGEASSDFALYALRFEKAMKQHSDIKVIWSSRTQVRFTGNESPPVPRKSAEGGWGFVFYTPGAAPVVYRGVATDDHLVCIASRLFKRKVNEYACET